MRLTPLVCAALALAIAGPLYGTVPGGYPKPGLFQESFGWLNENGIGLRYQSVYSNGWPAPPRLKRAGQGQGQGRIDAPDAHSGVR